MRTIGVFGTILLLCAAAAGIVAQNRGHHAASVGLAALPTQVRTSSAQTPARPSPTATPTPAPRPAPPAPAIGPGMFTIQCTSATPNGVRATLLWTPSRSGQQWLDLSIFNDGFAPANFISAGAFPPLTWGYIWDGLLQGTTHYARVNTLTAAGWMPSGTFAFYTPVCDPASYAPPPGPDMLRLRDSIAGVIAGSGIDTAVAITDLRTNETIDVNGDQNRLPGCTINLFALLRVAVDLQAGRYPEPAAGDLIARTIFGSNPITARELVKDYLGGGDVASGMQSVNDFMHALGMNATLMDHPPAFPDESLNGGIDNRITARDVNLGLKAALWDGLVLSPGWRDYMLQKMEGVKPGLNYLIPAGVGSGANVSHKNGFLYSEGWADNDIGIVWFERGGQRYGYAISFFTQGVSQKYADIGLGQRISSLAYQWLAARYGR